MTEHKYFPLPEAIQVVHPRNKDEHGKPSKMRIEVDGEPADEPPWELAWALYNYVWAREVKDTERVLSWTTGEERIAASARVNAAIETAAGARSNENPRPLVKLTATDHDIVCRFIRNDQWSIPNQPYSIQLWPLFAAFLGAVDEAEKLKAA